MSLLQDLRSGASRLFDRVKARKQRLDEVSTPDRVTKIAANIAAARNLREIAGKMHKEQRQYRLDAPLRRALNKSRNEAHRNRVRMPPVHDLKVIDTGTNRDRTVLYFELGNGQIVNANKYARTPKNDRDRRRSPTIRRIIVDELNAAALRAQKQAA